MSFKEDIIRSFQQGSLLTKLIYLNLGVFAIVSIIHIIVALFMLSWHVVPYVAMPACLPDFVLKPWTLISYMFLHVDVIHLLLNILMLYWMGQLFLYFFSQKQLLGVYILGGIFGGLFYLLAYNLIPYYILKASGSYLMGASASVMALIVAAAVWSPQYPVRLALVGEVKLGVIALVYVALSLLGIVSSNAGGQLAHLGGAVAGYLFATRLKNGSDITGWVSRSLDAIVNLFQRKPTIRVVNENPDMEYNRKRKAQDEDIDRILEKIKRSGYDSLSEDERLRLFSRKK